MAELKTTKLRLAFVLVFVMLLSGLGGIGVAQQPTIRSGTNLPAADALPTNFERTPIPNLVGTLMAPKIGIEGEPVSISGTISNVGEQAGESRAVIYQVVGQIQLALNEITVTAKLNGESQNFSFDWFPSSGLSHIRLVADVHGSAFESNESDNIAETWIFSGEVGGDDELVVGGPPTAQPVWGWPTSVVLQHRPMRIGATTTTNGLRLNLDDGNVQGQDFWVNASWLRQYDVDQPVFSYDDASLIPYEHVGDYFLVQAPHFSIVHVTDAEAAIFDLLGQEGDAVVTWNNILDRVDITSAAHDAADTSLVTGFVPHRSFQISVDFGVDVQGHEQEVYPLALGSKAERAAPSASDYPASSFGFRYVSGRAQDSFPTIEAFYREGSAPAELVWIWVTHENPDGAIHTFEDWNVELILRRVTDSLFFELRDSAGNLDRSESVPAAVLPLGDVDSVFFGNRGDGSPATAPAQAWASSFVVNPVKGDLVLEEIDSVRWAADGSASIDDGVELTRPFVDPQYDRGRAWLNGCPGTDAFSAQFTYVIQPQSSTDLRFPGFVFFFGKNLGYAPAPGALLGFEDTAAGTSGHEGFGIVFDGRKDASTGDANDGFVAIVKDSLSNRLASVIDPRVNDLQPHVVNVEVFAQRVVVYMDGRLLLHAQTPAPSSFDCLGFSSSSGRDQVVRVSDFLLSALPPNDSPYVPGTPYPITGSSDVPRTLDLTWTGADPQGTKNGYRVIIDDATPPRWDSEDPLCGIVKTPCIASRAAAGGEGLRVVD